MNRYTLTDAHCHLDFEVFDHDRADVLQRAKENNIKDIIIPGTQKIYWQRIKNLCSEFPQLHACYGLHPYWVDKQDKHDIEKLSRFIEANQPVAVGECGLDFRQQQADEKTQLYFFEAQLDIADIAGLPVVIHAVRATEKVLQVLKKYKNLRGMIHSYSGSVEQAKQLIDLDFFISISASVTYEKASSIRRVVKELPISSLLLETDAPDQPGQTQQGKRNEPSYITSTVKTVSDIREEAESFIAEQTTINAKKLFDI